MIPNLANLSTSTDGNPETTKVPRTTTQEGLYGLPRDVLDLIFKKLEKDAFCNSLEEACASMRLTASSLKAIIPCDDPAFWKERCTEKMWTFGSEKYVPIRTKSGDNSLERWKKQYLMFCKIANHEVENVHVHVTSETVANWLTNLNQLGSSEEIAKGAFEYCRPLQLTHLPEGIKKINLRAFKGCINLTLEEGLPDSVVTISQEAFLGCINLDFYRLPQSLKEIYSEAFKYCKKLSLTGPPPPNLKTIFHVVFKGCTRLAPDELSPTLEGIGHECFRNCTSLTLTKLPENVWYIGKEAFFGCEDLALTRLPEKLIHLSASAFEGCKSLQITEFPDRMKQGPYPPFDTPHPDNSYIGPNAFDDSNPSVEKLADKLYDLLKLKKNAKEPNPYAHRYDWAKWLSDTRVSNIQRRLFCTAIEARIMDENDLVKLKWLEELRVEDGPYTNRWTLG